MLRNPDISSGVPFWFSLFFAMWLRHVGRFICRPWKLRQKRPGFCGISVAIVRPVLIMPWDSCLGEHANCMAVDGAKNAVAGYSA